FLRESLRRRAEFCPQTGARDGEA
ncbi:phage minor tail protein G, partial [Escherichia coli]